MNNRKMRRILEKKLGADFPITEMLALMEYYSKLDMNVEDFFIILLKKYIPIDYKVHCEEGFINADK